MSLIYGKADIENMYAGAYFAGLKARKQLVGSLTENPKDK
jgi:hypothetical protein